MEQLALSPIGTYHGDELYKQQQPRQGSDSNASGYISLLPHQNFEQALEDLEGFSHIWVLFQFHHNRKWRPKVAPPHTLDNKKKGVFATRSPHRPNSIGMSAVKLEKIDGLKLYIKHSDLLDGTPILDIKPYLPYADSFPEATTGWVPPNRQTHTLLWSDKALEQAQFILESDGSINLVSLAEIHLGTDPLNKKRKRLKKITEHEWHWAFRTWRVHFTYNNDHLDVFKLSSAYTASQLLEEEDLNVDKELHKKFVKQFRE